MMKKGGISILGILLLGVIIILVLSYFGISLKSFVESPVVDENMSYVGGVLKTVWNDYLKKPATFIWEKLIVKSFESLRNSEAIDINKLAPKLDPNY